MNILEQFLNILFLFIKSSLTVIWNIIQIPLVYVSFIVFFAIPTIVCAIKKLKK